ncbi:MAG: hypothetical protein WDM78_01805 [Puia sp.]
MKLMHWNNALGKRIDYNGHHYSVIGEVSDFRYDDFQTPIGPFLLMAVPRQTFIRFM